MHIQEIVRQTRPRQLGEERPFVDIGLPGKVVRDVRGDEPSG